MQASGTGKPKKEKKKEIAARNRGGEGKRNEQHLLNNTVIRGSCLRRRVVPRQECVCFKDKTRNVESSKAPEGERRFVGARKMMAHPLTRT